MKKHLFAPLLLCILGIQLSFFLAVYAPTSNYLTGFINTFFHFLFFLQMYRILRLLADNAQMKNKLNILEAQSELRREQELIIQKKEEELNHLGKNTHDQMQLLLDYLKKENYTEAKSFLTAINHQFQEARFIPICQNNLINAILDSKRQVALQYNIKVEYSQMILLENSSLPPSELSSILFNLMDNAINACRQSAAESPYIKLSVTPAANYIHILMRNSKNPEQSFSRETTNNPLNDHGFGLSIIEDICRKYNGICEWTDSGSEFLSSILLA